MPVPSSMADLSTTAASNYPTGSDSPTSGDDYFRSIQAIIRSTNAKGADIASATTTDIGAATGEFVDVTGTTTITGLGTIAAGIVRTVRFTGALTLTHNATSLILPGSANITTTNGDAAQFRSLGSGNWKCINYMPQAGYLAKSGGTLTGALNEAQGADIASAATVNLTTATGNYVHITGTTTITAITLAQGAERTVVFDGALTLTDGASLLLPASANITTAAGDSAIFRGESAGVVRCIDYIRKSGSPLVAGADASATVKGIVELATSAEIKTGTDTVRVVVPSELLAAQGFSAYFQSAEQTITSAGALTVAHGLARSPILVQFYLICKTAENGYSIGDTIYHPAGASNSASDALGVSCIFDATNINIRFGSNVTSSFTAINKGTGGSAGLTNANWKLIIRAWA